MLLNGKKWIKDAIFLEENFEQSKMNASFEEGCEGFQLN